METQEDNSIFNRSNTDGSVGLSIGLGGKVIFTEAYELDRFGWSSDNIDSSSNSLGTLDLTQSSVDLSSSDPVLKVGELWIEGKGTIKLDPTKYLTNSTIGTGKSVLDYQSADDGYYVVVAQSIKGSKDPTSISLDYDDSDTVKTTVLTNSKSGKDAANAHWNYSATVHDGSNGTQIGVYLSYSLVDLELTGLNDSDSSLSINLSDSAENRLYTKLTGEGILQITGSGDRNTLTISNESNAFAGLVDLDDNLTLNATGSNALGTGDVSLKLGESSTYQQTEDQILNGLVLGKNSKVKLSGNSTKLTLNLAAYQDGENKYLSDDEKQSVTFQSEQIEGESTTTLELTAGTVTFADAVSTLGSNKTYKGSLSVGEEARMVFQGTLIDEDIFTLSDLSGTGTVQLELDTHLGNVEGFNGTVALNKSEIASTSPVLTIDSDSTNLSSAPITVVNASSDTSGTVRFENVQVEQGYIDDNLRFTSGTSDDTTKITNFEFSGTTGKFSFDDKVSLKLEDSSHITRDRDQFDTAFVGSDSTLTYQMDSNPAAGLDLTGISGEGTLEVTFGSVTETTISQNSLEENGSEFTGTLKLNNGNFAVGEATANTDLFENSGIKLYVGSGSTLEMKDTATAGADVTLGSNSTINFGSSSVAEQNDASSFDLNNVLDMGGHYLKVDGAAEAVIAKVDTDVEIKLADVSKSLLESVMDESDGISVTLISNIEADSEADLAAVADGMSLNVVDNSDEDVSATVTYKDAVGENIADITTGVDISHQYDSEIGKGSIGLSYNEVTKVAVYSGAEAIFEAKENSNSTISAQLSDKEPSAGETAGSLTFKGHGKISLTGATNDYTGKTNVDGVTLIAQGENSLGNTSGVYVCNGATLQITGSQANVGGLHADEGTTVSIGSEDGSTEVTVTLNNSEDSLVSGQLKGNGTLELEQSTLTFDSNEEQTVSVKLENGSSEEQTQSGASSVSTVVKEGIGNLNFENGFARLNLTVNSGNVTLKDGDSVETLAFGSSLSRSGGSGSVTVNGLVNVAELTGSGTFNMTVSFGDGSKDELNSGSVGLRITEGEGSHYLNVTSADTSKGGSETIKIIEVEQGDADFTLANGMTAVTSGGYDYELMSESNGSGGTSFYLDSKTDTERKISVTAGAYTAIASAAQLFDVSLHDRVGNRSWVNPLTGEKSTTSIWGYESVIHERYRDSSGQLGIHNTSSVTMVGGDFFQWTPSGNGQAYFGAMAGYGMMDSKSRSRLTNSRSDADTDAWGVGFYGGWKGGETTMTGPFVDGWVMFTHATSHVDSSTGVREEVRGRGLSASLEAGWGFDAFSYTTDSGKIADVIIEPHASVTWFGMEYDDLHTDSQDVSFEGTNNVRTRLGARFIISERDSPNFNAFIEANWVHNTEDYGATISGIRVDQAGARDQGEGRIGLDWRITNSLSTWVRLGISVGDDGYNEREGTLGVRYRF